MVLGPSSPSSRRRAAVVLEIQALAAAGFEGFEGAGQGEEGEGDTSGPGLRQA